MPPPLMMSVFWDASECPLTDPYKVKGIVSSDTIELELPKSIKIHPVVNVSKVQLYKP